MLILSFMYIFGFVLFKSFQSLNSTILVGVIFGVRFLMNKKYRNTVLSVIRYKRVFRIFSMLFFIITYSICITTLLGAYDYTILKTFLNQAVNLFIGLLLYSAFKEKNKEEIIFKYIIYAFILQASIQLISFISPNINEVLNVFRPQEVIEKGQWGYSGIRGLAIAGSNFYGLSSAYGLMFIMYFMNWNKIFNNDLLVKILSLGLLAFGSLSAGRTSLIGFFIGASILVVTKIEKIIKKSKLKKINIFKKKNILFSFVILAAVLISSVMFQGKVEDNLVNKIENMKKFAFEMFYNIKDGKGFNTTSTTKMFDNMYFSVNADTLILGDGKYTNEDGSYYMNTDVGYMRNILFFGLIGISFMILYQSLFFLWSKEARSSSLIFFMYILIIHLKGDILGFLIITQNIFLLYYLYSMNKKWLYKGGKHDGKFSKCNNEYI